MLLSELQDSISSQIKVSVHTNYTQTLFSHLSREVSGRQFCFFRPRFWEMRVHSHNVRSVRFLVSKWRGFSRFPTRTNHLANVFQTLFNSQEQRANDVGTLCPLELIEVEFKSSLFLFYGSRALCMLMFRSEYTYCCMRLGVFVVQQDQPMCDSSL